jgi:hypothetical protein
MVAPWRDDVPYVRDGEPVTAAVDGRPLRALAGRSEYLKDRIDAAEMGEAVVRRAVSLDPAAAPGFAVYWDAAQSRFAPALAAVAEDPETGGLVPAASAEVVGIVAARANSTLGDVVLLGRTIVDLTAAIGEAVVPGRYYLSSSRPGGLERRRPPAGIPVLYADGAGSAYVLPALHGLLEQHVHHRFALFCQPAGGNNVGEGRHAVADPDPALPGWLPADHASFGGSAPTGAAFGYNLAAHPELARAWPPVPIGSVALWWDTTDGGRLVPQGKNALVFVDRTTIWWMSDCAGDVPWPADYDADAPPAPVPDNAATPECPRATEMRLVLSFTEMLFATEKSVVTGLDIAEGAPLTLRDCHGAAARTGDLTLGLALDFTAGGDAEAGDLVFKAVEGTTFRRGPVIEGIIQGTGLLLTSTRPRSGDGATVHQGIVTASADTDPGSRELLPQVVDVRDAQQRTHKDVLYLGFPAGYASSIRMRFAIPAAGLPPDPQFRLRLLLFAPVTGTLPATIASYRRLPRPGAGLDVALPTADAPLTCNTNLATVAERYREVESAAVAVAAGDVLYVTFGRQAPDGYSGELGLVQAAVIVTPGA